jgi:UTP--glucose-1-phosphate uridylyltransferase
MPIYHGDFLPFAEKMQSENLPYIFIKNFEHYYSQLVEGHTGLIPENAIKPVTSLPDAETLTAEMAEIGHQTMSETIMLKLNGGLGTSMGLKKAKSLLKVKNGLTFLDVIARQVEQSKTPLVLMNSFNTRDDSLAVLNQYKFLQTDIPLDFLQHKEPKIVQEGLVPASWPDNPELEWCPPGHGDIYTALITSGMLHTLLEAGYKYIFVSNVDNLGAAIDPKILGYFVSRHLPFMMEVADRTEADKKGGHLAQQYDGQYLLRESAQCPPEDEAMFQDINRHRYFNTNNLWIRLPNLQRLLARKNNVLGLAMIRNSKTLDPRDKTTPPVYQLETAMGSAISVFEGAGAIRVPRHRFAPIKKTNDLLNVRSNNYVLSASHQITPSETRTTPLTIVDLEPKYYQLIDDLESRFPYGPPSLLQCDRLIVRGDVKFGKNVTLKGAVVINNDGDKQMVVEDNAVISG